MHDPIRMPTAAEARPQRRHRGLYTGIGLILLGVLFLLHNLDVVDFRYSWESWPLLLVIFGIVRMLDRGDRSSGLWLVVVGLWLYVNERGFWGFSYGNSWPLMLVFIGISMIWKTMHRAATPPSNGESR